MFDIAQSKVVAWKQSVRTMDDNTSSQRLPPLTPIGKHVALLQGDASESELIHGWLTTAGHLCTRHDCGYAFMRALRRVSFDIVVLDWHVGNLPGEFIVKHLRANLRSRIPIVFVSAVDQEAAIVSAFRWGADDYMVKPVRRMELVARLDAHSRRARNGVPVQPPVVEKGNLRLDCQGRIAWREGRSISLTAKGFDLAVLFLTNAGRLLSRREIQDGIWGHATSVDSRTLDTYVSRVRTQLGLTPQYGWHLGAVYGYGYRLDQVDIAVRPAGEAPTVKFPPPRHDRQQLSA